MTATTDPYAHVPVPVGAVDTGEWGDVGHPDAFRQFNGPKRIVKWRDVETDHPDEATLYVAGTQLADGTVEERHIRAEGISWEDALPADTARELSRVFADLANELDGMQR